MRRTLAQMGQGACPCGALCLPKWGTLLAPNGHKHWQNSAQMIYPKTVIRPFIVFYIYCLQSFVFYKASFACF